MNAVLQTQMAGKLEAHSSTLTAAPKESALDRLIQREEVLQICYWFQGEGLGDIYTPTHLCRRVTVLEGGRVLTEGNPIDVFADPRVMSAYMGSRKLETHEAHA